jgi:hypothetical protein
MMLLQLRVLRLGLLQDGNVRVGVFPEGEEVLTAANRRGAAGLESAGLNGDCQSAGQL